MEYIFLSSYKILGIKKHDSINEVILFESVDPIIKVSLLNDPDETFYILDRQIALGNMLLDGLTGKKHTEEFNLRLNENIKLIREGRKKIIDYSAVLAIQIKGDVEVEIDTKKEIDDFIACFDAYDKNELKANINKIIDPILAAVRIGGEKEYNIEKLSEGSYLINSNAKVVHSFSIESGTPSLYTSSEINESQINNINKYIPLISKNTNLARVIHLFVNSIEKQTGNYRSFISAWLAIEILINKIFRLYESELKIEISKISAAPGLANYLERITIVMKDKYSLLDKFSVISIFLGGEKGDNDIKLFKKIKKIRDDISHGNDKPETKLPLIELQSLLEKYLRNHIDRFNN